MSTYRLIGHSFLIFTLYFEIIKSLLYNFKGRPPEIILGERKHCIYIYGSICVEKINLQCKCKIAMQYVKWQYISVFKFTFSNTYVQHFVQNENETEN